MSRFVITGAVGGSPNRLEIHDFIKNDKFFSLYIQALKAISEQDQSILLSFFQVGGIHGLPYVVWDGSTGSPPTPDQWEGYCTHGSVLFPTWHRPYVMLYEQILQKRAIEIAATYQTIDKEAWKLAAVNLRQPFWDWAKNSVPPDEVIVLKQVTITGPDGKQVKVDNPLYHYTFHPIDPSFPGPYGVWPTTLRHPTSTGADATDDITALKNALSSAQTDITTKTYNLLTRVLTWPAFSNHTVGNGGSTSNSLEGIHDGIHFDIGANGHMGNPAVAGFDPIFFLHHANVDRLLSLWFALHSVWVSPGSSNDGSFTIAPGVTVDENTALTPFWNTQTTFWPSSSIEDTSKLGYTYPDFNGLGQGTPDALRTAIGNVVNRLYSSPISSAPFDWTARIEFKKYEVGTSFAVLLFLGEVPENPKEWRTTPKYVGAHYAFVNSVAQRCANCRNQENIVVEGFVHLNPAIVKLSGLASLLPALVEPYLTGALHWKVQKADGTVVELESLEVSVFSTPLSYPSRALFPVPGEGTRHNGITHGRNGGSRQPLQ